MQETVNAALAQVKDAARYKWQALVAAWAVCVVGWAVIMVLPNRYESHARMFADTRSALGPVIKDLAIQQDMTAQLSLVQESLLGDAQLNRVINELGLIEGDASPDDLAKKREQLRRRIEIDVDAVGNVQQGQSTGSIYWLSYQDPNRDRSLQVVTMLLDSFVKDTVSGKLQNSETAQRFLADRLREGEMRLREAERRLADFKKENVGMMPGAEGDYFTRLQSEIDSNRKARTALSVALNRREELNRQLREGATSAAATGTVVRPLSPDGRAVSAGDTAGRLVEARQKLADLLSQYTEKHPAVGALREEIADLEARRTKELEALRQGDPEAVAATGASANPVYQSIQLALNQVDVEVASLRGEIGQHEVKIAELQRLVKTVPEVEAEFARLNRDYDVTKAQYQALLERLGQAKLGQDAEETGSTIKLEVLNPPTASPRPVWPRRPLMVLAVFLVSLPIGAGLAYLLAKMNPVFDHSKELEAATGRPVLGVVSLTTIETHQAQVKQGALRYAAVVGALVLTFLAVMLISMTTAGLHGPA